MKAAKWTKFRHRVSWKVLRPFVHLLSVVKYNVRIEKFKGDGNRQYLILSNHQTPYDQFFVGCSFRMPIYFIATEDIFSLGFASKLISYLFAPIPIRKYTTDLRTVKNCFKVIKEGGSISIFPEGNTTYSGHTGYIKPGTAALAKKFRLPIAIFRIEGGYGKHPRWSDVVRKGPLKAGVSRVIEPEEYANLTNEEFLKLIEGELYVNECETGQSNRPGVENTGKSSNVSEYRSDHLAEYMERAVYTCPNCGLSEFVSRGDECKCLKCERTIRYCPDKTIVGKGFDFPYKNMGEWYDSQCDFVNSLDTTAYTKEAVYTDTVAVFRVIPFSNKQEVCENAKLMLFGDRIGLETGNDTRIFRFDDLTGIVINSSNKLELCEKEEVLQFRGNEHFNALKYVNFYHRYKNIMKEDTDTGFLGL